MDEAHIKELANAAFDAIFSDIFSRTVPGTSASIIADAIRTAVAEERERCAKVAETSYFRDVGASIAVTIRGKE